LLGKKDHDTFFNTFFSTYAHTNVLELQTLAQLEFVPSRWASYKYGTKGLPPKDLGLLNSPGQTTKQLFVLFPLMKQCHAPSAWLVPKLSTSFVTVFWFFLSIYRIGKCLLNQGPEYFWDNVS